MNCSNCSAKISGDALACPYCGTETALAVQARALKEQQQRHAAQLAEVDAGKARKQAVAGLESAAKMAFYASIFGVVCCIPVGSIVGLVLGVRARKTAGTLGAHAPWQSMAAIVLAIFWIGFFSLAMVMGAVSEREKAARVAALRTETKDSVRKPALDSATACALTEIALLEGSAGQTRGSIEVLRCDGALEQTGTTAVLKDVEFSRQTTKPATTVDSCLSYRTKWKVDWIGTGPKCGEGDRADAGVADDED